MNPNARGWGDILRELSKTPTLPPEATVREYQSLATVTAFSFGERYPSSPPPPVTVASAEIRQEPEPFDPTQVGRRKIKLEGTDEEGKA